MYITLQLYIHVCIHTVVYTQIRGYIVAIHVYAMYIHVGLCMYCIYMYHVRTCIRVLSVSKFTEDGVVMIPISFCTNALYLLH